MPVNPENRVQTCTQAEAHLRRFRLYNDAAFIFEAAREGDDDMLSVVEQFVLTDDRTALERLITGVALRLSPKTVRRIAFDFLKQSAYPLAVDPDITESDFFAGRDYGRTMRAGEPDGPTILEEVRAGLKEKVEHQMIGALRMRGTDAVRIPPPPSSEAFTSAMREQLGPRGEAIEAWTRWPLWNEVLVTLFREFLNRGISPEADGSIALQMESAFALRKAWFRDLTARGFTSQRLAELIEAHAMESLDFDNLRGVAELQRITGNGVADLPAHPRISTVLAADVIRLHGLDPAMKQAEFLHLLPPYVAPLTPKAARALLRKKDLATSHFTRFLAETMLLWHLTPSAELVQRLCYLVYHIKRVPNLKVLCSKMLNLPDPECLFAKTRELLEAGIDVDPLFTALAKRFPREVPQKQEGPERDNVALPIAGRTAVSYVLRPAVTVAPAMAPTATVPPTTPTAATPAPTLAASPVSSAVSVGSPIAAGPSRSFAQPSITGAIQLFFPGIGPVH
jgi:hypothetical protein